MNTPSSLFFMLQIIKNLKAGRLNPQAFDFTIRSSWSMQSKGLAISEC